MQLPFKRDVRIALASIAVAFVLGTLFGAFQEVPDDSYASREQGTVATESTP